MIFFSHCDVLPFVNEHTLTGKLGNPVILEHTYFIQLVFGELSEGKLLALKWDLQGVRPGPS